VRKDGRTEWIPPPHLDTGQTRINDYHHPERMLNRNNHEDDDGPDDEDGGGGDDEGQAAPS
jgi:hypothetical protein